MIDLFALLYILAAAIVILFIFAFRRMLKVRVWISKRSSSKQPLREIGFLDLDDTQTAGEIYLTQTTNLPPVARVIVNDENKVDAGFVELLTTNLNDDSVKPRYRNVGYISFDTSEASVDEYGYIYKQIKGKKEYVGYTACPSKPHTPTICGERSWKSLWLKCTLCAYEGIPNPELDKKAKGKKNKSKKSKEVEMDNTVATSTVERLYVHAKKTIDSDEFEEEIDIVTDSNDTIITDLEATEVTIPTHEEQPATDSRQDDAIETEEVVEVAEETQGEVVEVVAEIEKEEDSDGTTPVVVEVPEEESPNLTDEEKSRLDRLKLENPQLLASIARNMVMVEGGEFTMGDDSVTSEGEEVNQNTSPAHKVKLSTYYMAKYPVTQLEWIAIMGDNVSDCQDDERYPVAPITWNQAQAFLLRLSYLMGEEYSLPTEAQWEYAARGGKNSKGYIYSGSDNFAEVGWSDHRHVVGEKKPNELGLYDMSGLVREWCSDFWGHYSAEEQIDPIGPKKDSPLIMLSPEGEYCHVVRSLSGNEKVVSRKGETSDLNKDYKSYGFRYVCSQKPKEQEETDEAIVEPVEPIVVEPVLLAECSFWGFHSSRKDYLPAEARACAYALLSKYSPIKNSHVEYYKEKPYGWRDTALLTSLVYVVLYVILYTFNTGVLQMPMLEHDVLSSLIFISYYFVLWAIVRYIKIEAIENSPAVQYKLDLFNKNLSINFFNILIVVLSFFAILFTLLYYDYDFIPLIFAILFGVAINMSQQTARKRWIIKSDFKLEEDEEETEEDEVEIKNPDGDIARLYEWNLDSSNHAKDIVRGNLTLHFRASEIADLRHCNPFFSQRKDLPNKECILNMFYFLKENKSYLDRVKYIAYTIEKIANKHSLSEDDKIQFVLDFVQEPNIEFQTNKECKTLNYYAEYIRFPDETLYDKVGDCNSKSLLAAMIFNVMGYDVLYLYSRVYQHAAIGVRKVDISNLRDSSKDNVIEFNGNYYIYCETTSDNFVLGDNAGIPLDDFNERVLLPVVENDSEDTDLNTNTSISHKYEWDLDSALGNKLKGSLVLNFDKKTIEKLREKNPFRTYGRDSHTYQDNVRDMFSYLKTSSVNLRMVQAIASYIRESVTKANLPEIDMLQFALDFVQMPNINYVIDENSAGIGFAKEYMRYPDEVLFDKEGDCDCKSSLMAGVCMALGYDVLFMLSQKLGHAAIGIECKDEWLNDLNLTNKDAVVRNYNGKSYIYCETTGDGFRIGNIKEGDSIQDFETIVELSLK